MLQEELKNVVKIEIEPPYQIDGPPPSSKRVVIVSAPTLQKITSALKLKPSSKNQILECKVPPGFYIRFVTAKGRFVEMDVTISGHKHLVVKGKGDEETVHYELPSDFEKIIYPYLLETLK